MLKKSDLEEKLAKERREAEENDAKRRAARLGLPYLDLISVKVPTEIKAMRLVPEAEAKRALLVPLQLVREKLILAAFDPTLPETKKIIDELKKNYAVTVYISSLNSLKHAWSFYQYIVETKEITGRVEIDEGRLQEIAKTIQNLENFSQALRNFQGPFVSQILEIILAGSLTLKASDIHLEPQPAAGILRLRLDGVLHTIFDQLPMTNYKSLVARIKLLSGLKLNIADRPQDGRFTIHLKDRDIEIRTSIIPSEYGETAVMRILDPLSLKVNLEELGWRADDLEIAKSEIQKPNGLILNTGPTGSGKTTTLYAFLRALVSPEIKIITIEDPIEYHLPGVSQTQVNPDANYTFASGLRSILRQDPDIVLVGEIRDKETAEIALNASLTGHLVFSTLHTNDAVGAVPRLIDLGAKPQILGPGLNLIIAQRLVRILCTQCKKAKEISGELRQKINKFLDSLPKRVNIAPYANPTIYEPGPNKNCQKCFGFGYKGRTSIFELFRITPTIEEAIYKNPNELELARLAKNEGLVTMQEDGVLKVLLGITSFEEIENLTGKIEWLH
jgi:type IV pilus assembly protein PilB